jgi:translation initiation factor 1 (eIF-1/SUI1)
LNSSEIRNFILNYIKEKGLQLESDPKMLKPDETIFKYFITKNVNEYPVLEDISFIDLFTKVFASLPPMHSIEKVDKQTNQVITTLADHPVFFKGKFQPVEFKIESRGGNKKVTTVHRLARFDNLNNPQLLQVKIRKIIGCSVSISNGSNDDFIVCIQGNQIRQVADILKNEFAIQFKHMSGLELATKK